MQEEIFSIEQDIVIKRSFNNLENKLGISSETPSYLKKSFEQKLNNLEQRKSFFSVRWKGFTVSILTAFSVGLLISRFLMTPTAVLTRSLGDESQANHSSSIHKYVSKQVFNPKEFTFKVIEVALDAEMEVEVTNAGDKFGLYIKPFKPNDKNQEKIRFMLDLHPETSGTVNLIVGLRKK